MVKKYRAKVYFNSNSHEEEIVRQFYFRADDGLSPIDLQVIAKHEAISQFGDYEEMAVLELYLA